MLRRILAGTLGGLSVVNGFIMLVDGERWFISAAASTGPFNPHFVADVGVAFIAAGLALSARSWRTNFWPAALAGSAFLVFHALIHIVEFALHQHEHDLAPMLGVVIPAALAMWAALPTQGEIDVQVFRSQTD